MHIKRLPISRYRVLKEFVWHPVPGINCLIEQGDSGKSTLLAAAWEDVRTNVDQFCLLVGLDAMAAMFKEDAAALCVPPHRRDPSREATAKAAAPVPITIRSYAFDGILIAPPEICGRYSDITTVPKRAMPPGNRGPSALPVG